MSILFPWHRCSTEDDESRLPLFEALDSLTWPRFQGQRIIRTASPKSTTSTTAVLDAPVTSTGGLGQTIIGSGSPIIVTNVELHGSTEEELEDYDAPKALSRTSITREIPQSPDLIMCSSGERSGTLRKTYVPNLPHTKSTFKPLSVEKQHKSQKSHDRSRKRRSQTEEQMRPTERDSMSSVQEDSDPQIPEPMQDTDIARFSPLITSATHLSHLNSPKRQSLASLYGNRKLTNQKCRDRSLSPLSEKARSPKRGKSLEPMSPGRIHSPQSPLSPLPAPNWSTQVDEAFRRLQLTTEPEIDVVKTSIVWVNNLWI